MALRTTIEEYAYAAMRIVTAFLFIFHGLQKLFGLFDGRAAELMSLRGAAGIIEVTGGALVLAGLLTRVAAFICSGEMAFAYFIAHSPRGLWPIQNGGELAVFYCFVFLFISARGAGPLSLDRLVRGVRT
ncbi:MAG TPA: DoxX family protein [Vicinamibacterales bacterium]|nr:DoxX family protein [Vicinamibacterales bacterium]